MTSPDARPTPVVLCAGIAVEDFLFKVERVSRAGRRRCAPRDLVATTGGCAANAAVAVARLGGAARFSGPVGTDDASRRFLDALAQDRRRYLAACCASKAARSRCPASSSTATARRWWRRCHGERLDDATPPDAGGAGRRHRRAAGRQPLPGFRAPDLPRRRARAAFRWCSTSTRRRRLDDPLFATASHRHLLVGGAARHHRASPISARRSCASSPRRARLPRRHQRPGRRAVDRATARCGGCRCSRSRPSTRSAPATPSTAALRWRWPRAGTRSPPCASAAAAAALKCTRFGGISGTPRRAEVEALLAPGNRLEIE